MKRILAFCLMLVIPLGVTACKRGAETNGSQSFETAAPTDIPKPTPTPTPEPTEDPMEKNILYITAGGTTFEAKLAENSSAQALKELLAAFGAGDVTVTLSLTAVEEWTDGFDIGTK